MTDVVKIIKKVAQPDESPVVVVEEKGNEKVSHEAEQQPTGEEKDKAGDSGKDVIDQGENGGEGENQPSKLWSCAANGELEPLEELLAAGDDPNVCRITDQSSPLYMAAQNGHLKVCKSLIAKGAKLDVTRDTGASSLLIATQNNHLEIVKLLVDAGANVHLENNQKATPFTLACSMGHSEIAEFLLNAGSSTDHKSTGLTPLQWSAKCKSQETKLMLLSYVSKDLQLKTWFRRWKRNALEHNAGSIPKFSELTNLDVKRFPFDLLELEEKKSSTSTVGPSSAAAMGGRQRAVSTVANNSIQPPLPLDPAIAFTRDHDLAAVRRKEQKSHSNRTANDNAGSGGRKHGSGVGMGGLDSSYLADHDRSRKDGPLVSAMNLSRDYMEFLPKSEQYHLANGMINSIPLSAQVNHQAMLQKRKEQDESRLKALDKRLKPHKLY